MSSLRVIASRITTKKVPALTLVVVGIIGMVAGVLAATITVSTNPYTGESGTYHNNTGAISVNDKGISIVSNVTGISANSTATFGANGTNGNLFNGSAFTLGHWMETLVFSITTTGGSHTVTIKIQSGSTPPNGGTSLAGGTVTLTLTGPGSASTGTVTAYLDLGVTSITGPMTLYVNAT